MAKEMVDDQLDRPGILSNVAGKFLDAGFRNVENTWREIARIRPVRDFKETTAYSLTGNLKTSKVTAGGEIKHGQVGELSYSNKADTYAVMIAVTRNDVINDDLNAISEIPQLMGRGAALSFNDVFWAAFMNNATFFTTAFGNAIEGVTVGSNDSRLNIEGLTRAETAYLGLTDPDGNPLGAVARKLLVPNALWTTARSLMNSTEIRDTTASTMYGTTNPHAGNYQTIRSSYLSNPNFTGYSPTAWYLLADPADIATIEVVFLNGQETPMVETADVTFDRLGTQMRVVHDFGVRLREKRGGLRAKGAA